MPPSHIILAMGQSDFALNYTFMSSMRQGSFNYQFEIFGLTRLSTRIELGTSQTQSRLSLQRVNLNFQSWYTTCIRGHEYIQVYFRCVHSCSQLSSVNNSLLEFVTYILEGHIFGTT